MNNPKGETCPKCESDDTDVGFGLAGGGYGAYCYCNRCGNVFNKVQEEPMGINNWTVKIDYTNYKGVEKKQIPITPLRLWHGHNEFYKQDQWLLEAIDESRGVNRTYAVCKIANWTETPQDVQSPEAREKEKSQTVGEEALNEALDDQSKSQTVGKDK